MTGPSDERPDYAPAQLVDYGDAQTLVETLNPFDGGNIDDGGGVPVYTS